MTGWIYNYYIEFHWCLLWTIWYSNVTVVFKSGDVDDFDFVM